MKQEVDQVEKDSAFEYAFEKVPSDKRKGLVGMSTLNQTIFLRSINFLCALNKILSNEKLM